MEAVLSWTRAYIIYYGSELPPTLKSKPNSFEFQISPFSSYGPGPPSFLTELSAKLGNIWIQFEIEKLGELLAKFL